MQTKTSQTESNEEKRKYVLAIDLGGGGQKVALVADTGQVIASEDESITTQMLPKCGAEQDPGRAGRGKLAGAGEPDPRGAAGRSVPTPEDRPGADPRRGGV